MKAVLRILLSLSLSLSLALYVSPPLSLHLSLSISLYLSLSLYSLIMGAEPDQARLHAAESGNDSVCAPSIQPPPAVVAAA